MYMNMLERFFPNRFGRNQREKEEQQKQTNAIQPLSHEFWRRGSMKSLENIALDKASDESSMLSGYLFAALDLRKTVFAEFCEENIVSRAWNTNSIRTYHPYLDLIENSRIQTEFDFWNDIATDWDMRGEVYIFLLRRVVYSQEKDKDGHYKIEHLGKPVSIEVLDANQVRPLKGSHDQIVGYEQWLDGSHKRVFAPEQIIHIVNKNPFDKEKPYSIFDIAKDYQYTMNKSADFTKSAIINNTNTPGILSTDQVLSDAEYDNLIARINGHEAGKVIVSDGSGKLTYTPVSQELDEVALPSIADVNRQIIFAITGTSKTMLGIEESGTTRDTSKVQTEKFLQRVIRPLAKRVISAFNFDYRIRYEDDYKKDPIDMILKGTVDSTEAQATYETQKYLYDSVLEMTYAGYTAESAENFLKGDIAFIDLEMDPAMEEEGEEPPEEPIPETPTDDTGAEMPAGDTSMEENPEEPTAESDMKSRPLTLKDIDATAERLLALEDAYNEVEKEEVELLEHNHHHEESLESWIDNALLKKHKTENGMSDFGQLQGSKLKGLYKNLLADTRKAQRDALKAAKITRNAKLSDIRTEEQENATTLALFDVFRKAMLNIIPIISSERKEEDKDLGLDGNVNILGDKDVKGEIDSLAMKCAQSHSETIYKTVLSTIEKVEKKKNSINLSEKELSTAVKTAYLRNSRQRAGVVAEDVFMRAVTTGMYYTDYLLLNINGKMAMAYKTLQNDHDDVCPLCAYMIDQPMRPFKEDFIQWKQDLAVKGTNGKVIDYKNNFAAVRAGELHPGCRCLYALVLKDVEKDLNNKE